MPKVAVTGCICDCYECISPVCIVSEDTLSLTDQALACACQAPKEIASIHLFVTCEHCQKSGIVTDECVAG